MATRRLSQPENPELVEKWKAALADGTASAKCDGIVRSSPVPMALANAIVAAIERDRGLEERGRLLQEALDAAA